MATERKRFYTLEEYFALARESEEKYEYWSGEIFLMGGASPEHVFIADNVLATLTSQLQGRNCRAMSSDIRVKVPAAPPFRYADVTIACGKLEFEEIGGLRVLQQFSNECSSYEIDHRSCGQDARAPSPSATQDPDVRAATGSAGVPPA